MFKRFLDPDHLGMMLVVLASLTLLGCGSGETESDKAENPSITELMDPMLNDVSEIVWDSAGFIDSYEGTIDLTPTTPEGWQAVADAADEITELANLLKQEQYSFDRPGWIALSQSLVVAADEVKAAVNERDSNRLFQAGAQLYQVCVACHQSFWSNNRFTAE